MYYRRTHGGATPPPGVDTSDHSGETTDFVPAPTRLMEANPVQASLFNGVDPANLGKGDWIWQMPQTQTHLGVSTVQAVIDYEVGKGMKWITVKCGDGANIWTQFTADLVTRAHNAGLKIFGWGYVYGSNPTGEANVAINAMNLGADGFIIDAESEYEVLANNSAIAAQYCQAIRAAYPDHFLAHAPFPYIQSHSGFPYVTFGTYCDAVMPQDYWGAIGISPSTMVTNMDAKWKTWQNGLTGTNLNAIKPIVPLAQSYAPVTGAEITTFVTGIVNDPIPATVGGYKGISFWDAQARTADMDAAVAAANIGTSNNPPVIGAQPLPLTRLLDVGSSVSFAVSVYGDSPLAYQWRKGGVNIAGATASTYSLTNVQTNQAGLYSIVVTNAFGAATSSVVTLTFYPLLTTVFSDNFDTNSSANWNLFAGSTTNISDYTATWAFDYTAATYTFNGASQFIPPAPSSTNSTKLGLKLTVNKNDANAFESGVSLYPKNQMFSGTYVLRFDMWMNYAGGAGGAGAGGSTEFATFGINHTGTQINWGAGTAGSSDGLWFTTTGEAGAARDYRAYVGNASGNPTLLTFAASGLAINGAVTDDAGDSFFQSLFPSPTYETSGAPGKHWVQGEISQMNGVLTWRLNGTVVAQRNNTSTYTSGNIMLGYMDIFSSIASPPADDYVIFDNVRVLVPAVAPSIATQPASLSVTQGSNATFNVTATGSAPLSYQWKFNGVNIGGATTSSYTRVSAQPVVAGDYSVVVTNVAGTVTSSHAVLTVNVPPTISPQPADATVTLGNDATFSAAASGTTPLNYQWKFNGVNIDGATTSSYTRIAAQANDAGSYSVAVTNVAGFAMSSNAVLTVNVQAAITGQPSSQTLPAGSNATFTVTATGTAPLGYQWFFNGVSIGAATSSAYTRLNVQTNDAGNYSVVVSNVAGTATSSNALLTVDLPVVPAQLQVAGFLPDGRVQLLISGQVGSNYAVDGSVDLSSWAQLTTFASTNGTWLFVDDDSTNHPLRFYRARLLP
jgi:hypothetical protein